MKTKRHIKNVMIFLVALVALVGAAVSVSADNYYFDHIEVNDLEIDDLTTLDVERGEKLDIEVYLVANATIDDVSITARINGYEYESIFDSTSQFSIESGNTYKKTLTLHIPDDIDASELYTLRIEASDKTNEIKKEINLHIDEARHDLKFFDVLLNPSSTIKAGNPVFVTVRLENLGEKEEDDIKVKVSIPDLGVSTVSYLNELNTEQQEDDTDNHFDEENSAQMDLLLKIPIDAPTGTYTLRVDVEYNRGHSFISQNLNLNVVGVEKDDGVQTILNSDSNSKATGAGETVQYKVMIANLGDEPGVYSVSVDGVSTWGEASVQPSFITVMPDSTGEVTITVTPFDGEETATHTWVARVMLGTDVLSEMVFTTKVDAAEEVIVTSGTRDSLKTALAVIFGVLVIVLVVLALVIAFRKVSGDEDEEETSSLEGQTYYQYYPKR
jgi:uncharacterized membrane protein